MKLNFDDPDTSAKGGKKAPTAAEKKKAAAKVAAEKKKAAPGKKTGGKQPPAKREKQELAPPSTASSGIHGEVDESDIILPRLNIVNPTSKLATEDDFQVGSFVLEKELSLGDKEDALHAVVLDITKLYQQKLDFDGGETPLTFSTLAEVKEAGGTLKWSEDAIDDERYYQSLAHVVLLLKAPEEVSADEIHRFPLEYDGSHWARCVFTVCGGAYTSFAKKVLTNGLGKLQNAGGLFTGLWTISSQKKSNDQNTWYVPVSKMVGVVNDQETFDFLAEQANDDFSAATSREDEE